MHPLVLLLPEWGEDKTSIGQDDSEAMEIVRDDLVLLIPLNDRPGQPGGHAVQAEAGAVGEDGLVGRLEAELGPGLLGLERERVEGEGVALRRRLHTCMRKTKKHELEQKQGHSYA